MVEYIRDIIKKRHNETSVHLRNKKGVMNKETCYKMWGGNDIEWIHSNGKQGIGGILSV